MKKKTQPKSSQELYSGIFKGHRLGYGFVKSLNGDYLSDIFIPKHSTKGAIEGDIVEVEVTSKESPKGWEGIVNQVLERKHQKMGAIVTETFSKKVLAISPLLGMDREIEVSIKDQVNLRVGDRIFIHLDKPKQNKKLQGRYLDYLGNIKDPSCDVSCAIKEYVLRDEFAEDVLEQVKSFPKKIIPKHYPDREDLTDLCTITIDPDTAKDFDDAISLEKSPKGHTLLGVHIADVSYFVEENSPLDNEASKRCNSTYFPGTCIPMLPSALSDNLCSLKPNVPRLAVSTFITLDSEGQVLNYRTTRSIIESKKRFTYKEVKKILDNKSKSPFKQLLINLRDVAMTLKQVRIERGCLDLALSEAKVHVDKKGNPTHVEVEEYDVTHQMIEEFMLKNNEIIAQYLDEKDLPIPFRIHDDPKSDNLKDFVYLAQTMGFKLSLPPQQKELQELFHEIKGSQLEHQLSVAFVRCMKLATYNPENKGHYGLQLTHYCHFTSPIRRYVDLVIHRTLFNQQSAPDLKEISERCSESERLSAKAETHVRTLKLLRLIQKENKPKKTQVYEAVVSKVKPFGIFFELPFYLLEGFIHISKIGRDYYIYNEKSGSIIGRDTKERLAVGSKFQVKARNICLLTQEVEWQKI